MSGKNLALNAVQKWVNKVSKRVEGHELKEFDAQSLKGLNEENLRRVLALVAAAYSVGCTDTREHIRALRDDRNNIEGVPIEGTNVIELRRRVS